MKALNAHQAARLLRWLEDLGYDEAWAMTAADLAQRLNNEDGQDCYTRSHLERRRAEVWPRIRTKPDRFAELERQNRELARELEADHRYMTESRMQDIADEIDEILQQGNPAGECCVWVEDESGEYWEGSCEAVWSFIAGGPAENVMRHCPGCGKPVKIEGENEERDTAAHERVDDE